MKKGAKAQAAMEYVMIAGLVAMIIIPTTFIFYNYASDSANEIDSAQIDKFGRDVVNTAETVYYLGQPSRIAIEERLPKNVESISIDRDPITGTYLFAVAVRLKGGIANFTYPTSIKLSGGFGVNEITPGIKHIRLESEKDDSGQPLVLVSFYPQKRVFVTSVETTGSLGGLSGADAYCQNAANTANIGGVWTAWLSTSTVNARNRILDTKYVRTDGLKVANNLADLLDGAIANPINHDENGVQLLAPAAVWTATDQTGVLAGPSCSDWTSSSTNGRFGATHATNLEWTDWFSVTCNTQQLRIYCFET